ncbi:hypothetical protein NIES4075_72900 [Tolypothrix sp. NIES-4075]|uniref:hypothetical protein n=1 Tax=Tolypothrix sp. NIES-4075 TaxID=2005459 RepID=UPI000B5C65CC|nr:hypothetical protein [Tolypothrix sp. NIES-4075]GAX46269.1 hypothetical protein NIES4075_72900 [Tolypothrix sp. NIES-4075]
MAAIALYAIASNSQFPIPNSQKPMTHNQRSPLDEAARLIPLFQATEIAGIELSKLIDFIEYHNPDIGRTTATLTAAFVLSELPAFLVHSPKNMQQLSAIANKFSQE